MVTHSDLAPTDTAPTLDLCISDPAALLNAIAGRYSSTERILMEFVDNAIDDAEGVYRANADTYPYEARVEILIDHRRRLVSVCDNCRGMRRETLERIVANVGESQKRGLTWVNGQFGFGVHAFRAAAYAIRFRTKHADDDHIELQLQRDQHHGIARPWPVAMPFPSNSGTGTEVTIGPFDEESFRDLTAVTVKREIEHHFERLLARPGLTITVRDQDGLPLRCVPFDYSQVDGEEFALTLNVRLGDALYPIEVFLKVAEHEAPERQARFFARGRRINSVADIASFMKRSRYRTAIWGHPHLLGYIEVGELVRPVITRDDFLRSDGRKALYSSLLDLEEALKAALDQINEAHRDHSFNSLEAILGTVLGDLAHEDRLLLRRELAAGQEMGALLRDDGGMEGAREPGRPGWDGLGGETDADRTPERDAPPEEPGAGRVVVPDPMRRQGTEQARAGFDIRFSALPPDLSGTLARSKLVDGTIYINTDHPDFQERLVKSRQGLPRFTDRLGAYLAATVSIHYKDQFYLRYGRQPERRDQMFDEQVAFMCRLEAALRPYLPRLQETYDGAYDDVAPEVYSYA